MENNNFPEVTKNKEVTHTSKRSKKIPENVVELKQIPDASELNKDIPNNINHENSVVVDGIEVEIKPTKLKYHRNRTSMAYRLIKVYPLPDILAMDKGTIDPNRDGDEILFDFLVAVFDDVDFVKEHYDNMDAKLIDDIVAVFCKINKIDDKEEESKNRAAKETRT